MPYKNPAKRKVQSRRWYRANKSLVKSRKPGYNKNRLAKKYEECRLLRIRNQEHARKHKAEKGCALCPMRDPRCLDFHHLRDKTSNISRACRQGWSLARLDA
jgi:hypothetical protein